MKKILSLLLGIIVAHILNAQYTLTDDGVVVTNGIIESCSYDFIVKRITIDKQIKLQVYPNLVSDILTIKSNCTIKSIEVISLTGVIVLSQTTQKNK